MPHREPGFPKQNEGKESSERGRDVEIVLKFMRHGERSPEGELLDIGRRITREKAAESGHAAESFDAVKAIGSAAGASKGVGMRAFETASIYADEIARDDAFAPRTRDALSYETVINPIPFDHDAIYARHLPDDFKSLSDEEKAAASLVAHRATVREEFALDTPEARAFRRESAGAYAHTVNHYRKMTKKLNSGSRVLVPAGTHGGIMEYLLLEATVHTDKDGKETVGYTDIEDIGGTFSPSEAYTVRIATDAEGNETEIVLSFDNPERPQGTLRLDIERLNELDEEYQELHKAGIE